MAKNSSKPKTATVPTKTTLSDLRLDTDLRYRILVLLHDFDKLGTDHLSAQRLSATTDELYISAPYFTESQCEKVRTAIVWNDPHCQEIDHEVEFDADPAAVEAGEASVEDAMHSRLAGFLERRKVIGDDARPCGPHDILPIYSCIFQVRKGDLMEEIFLSRLRRSGLPELVVKEPNIDDSAVKAKKKGKNRR